MAVPALLVLASSLLEVVALGGVVRAIYLAGEVWLGCVEMGLIGLLLPQRDPHSGVGKSAGIAGPKAHRATDLCLFSLILCALGDLVNRNFQAAISPMILSLNTVTWSIPCGFSSRLLCVFAGGLANSPVPPDWSSRFRCWWRAERG